MSRIVRSIASLARLAFRETIRSRLAASVAFAVACAIAAIRRATPSGDQASAHNFVFYSLVAVSAIIAVSILAAGASSIAGETRSKTLSLARVKPIPMFCFLAGRWIGISATFAAILAAALAAVAILAGPEAPSVCSRRVVPDLPDAATVAKAAVANAKAAGVTDPAELSSLRRDVVSKLPFATEAVSPGKPLKLAFPSPHAIGGDRPLELEIKFASDSYSATPLAVICSIRDAAAPESAPPAASLQITNITSRLMSLPFPSDRLAGAEALSLEIAHSGTGDEMPVLVQPRQAVAILVPDGPQSVNYVRAFLVILPIFALLAAAGLALGSLFSLPVALFCAAGLVISVFTADYSMSDPDALSFEDLPPPTPVQAVTRRVSAATVRTLSFVARTATAPQPAASLAGAVAIPEREITASVVWNGALLPATLLLAASAVLKRKELP